MGHRHVFGPFYMFETDNDQRWNLIEPPYTVTDESSGGSESRSLAYPTNNMSINGEQDTSGPLAQQDTSGPSNVPTGHENDGTIASSSSPANNDSNSNSSSNDSGSSSEISIPTDPWEETNMDIFHTPWEYPNLKRGHEGESSVRNVRGKVEPSSSSNGSMREWNPTHTYSSFQGHDLNPLLIGSSNSSNHVRGARSSYMQRSSSLQLGHSDEGSTERYASPHVRPTIAWRTSDRNARARISIERYQSFPEEASFHDRPFPEGLTIVDRSAYGSRNQFDHHQDMRLDIDDMSYEELLALGERIGSVSTGLSEDLISKCLRESIYCSDQTQEEGKCAICLEEYANMDDIGMIKGCKHDFHVGCIKKWLSMKNLCPICKSEPIKQ